MTPTRYSHLIRRVAGLLGGLAALLASIATGPAAFASPLRSDPPGWFNRLPLPVHSPPVPPGWNKHPPLPGPGHVHAALASGMPRWQITLIVVGAAVLATVSQATRWPAQRPARPGRRERQ
jgi:hypothetical protein